MRRGVAIFALAALLTCARAARAETVPPRLVTFVQAEYPAAARAEGRTAAVLLRLVVGTDGRVETAEIARSGGADFDVAALAAARRFVFEPARVDGKPARVAIEYLYTFTLRAEAPPPPPPTTGAIEGTVLDRVTRAPVAGVRVTLRDTGASVVTDDQGRFALRDVPPGPHAIALAGASLLPVTSEERVVAGERTVVEYDVERPAPAAKRDVDEEEVVRAPRLTRDAVATSVAPEQARLVPGTQGDTLKVVQTMPGVARAPLGSGQLVVWGSAPEDTRVFVDGVEIPALYHGGGLRGTVHTGLVKSIALVPGGYGADHGRGLGGLVKVETRALPSEVHADVQVDTLDASAMASAPIGDRVRVAVAGRYGYLDRVLSFVSAPDVGDYFPIPRYRDAQAKATIALRPNETLDAVVLGSGDDLTRTAPSSDPADVRRESRASSFERAYVRYARLLDDGSSVTATPFVGYDATSLVQSFGARPTSTDARTWRYGARASYRARVAAPATLTTGLDALGSASSLSRTGSLTVPPREGDLFVFGQPPPPDVNSDTWSTHVLDLAPYVTADVDVGRRVTLTPGVRVDALLVETSRTTPPLGSTPPIGSSRMEASVDPRLAARWEASDRVTLTAATGLYHQPPDPADLSAVFGTPGLSASRATHAAAGAAWRATDSLTVEATAFGKLLSDLPVRSRLPTPRLARALIQDGEGRAYGVQLVVRQELWRGFFGWVSYALSRSERRYLGDASWRLFDFDQPHVLSVLGSQTLGDWTFGARFRFASGYPRTPVVAALYDARSDEYQPVFGAQNGTRLPDFWQLDLRADRAFSIGASKLDVFLEVQNVTFHENREEIVYSFDFAQRGFITGLPTLAIAGVRWEL